MEVPQDWPDNIEAVTEKFWGDNPELKRAVLREWYCGGSVSLATNEAGAMAVAKWLSDARR